jgi:hypothetical protein
MELHVQLPTAFPLVLLSSGVTMQCGKYSKKTRMTHVPSDDEAPSPYQSQVENVPSTQYHLATSGNLGSSSRHVHVVLDPDPPEATTSTPENIELSLPDESPLHLEPGYIEHLNDDFIVSGKHQRTYVNTFSPRKSHLEHHS